MMTPEGKVKSRVDKTLKKLGCYYFTPTTGGYGRSGVSDRIVCYRGLFISIEIKAKGGKVTPLQARELVSVQKAGGLSMVIDESNVDQLEEYILKYTEKNMRIDHQPPMILNKKLDW